MPEKVIVNKDLKIIEVLSFGNVSLEDLKASLAAVDKISKETGIKKILVDTTKEESLPSTMEVFDFGARLIKGLQFVMIIKEDQATEEDLKFLRSVAVDRGVAVDIFYSKNEALDFLGM